jgi:transcriptional regulator with XRE-family HTH domain
MPSKPQPIFPSEQKILAGLGERIRLARLRRGISAEVLAERSSISRTTLHRAEQGFPAVAIGTYLRIMAALQLQEDFNLLAKDDLLGRRLQDLELSRAGKQSGRSE